jgi:uncharacterized membrane protein
VAGRGNKSYKTLLAKVLFLWLMDMIVFDAPKTHLRLVETLLDDIGYDLPELHHKMSQIKDLK